MDITLPDSVEARIPKTITVHGVTSVYDVDNSDTLRYFASLDLKELRSRQSLNCQQHDMAYDQDQREKRRPFGGKSIADAVLAVGVENFHFRDKGLLRLSVEEDLLTQAVGLISFDDWVVPEQIGYGTQCS